MKKICFLAALSLCSVLAACTTTSSTKVTAYDSSGNAVSSSTSSSYTNHAMDAMVEAGTAVKEGVVSGYEWTKDKTVKGYNWVKEKAQDVQDTEQQPVPEADPASIPDTEPLAQ